jgi:phage gp36-like protein
MSQYATLAEFKGFINQAEVSQLSNDDDSLIDGQLVRASTEIDSYLSRRYEVPVLLTQDSVLVSWCCIIARYFLFSHNGVVDKDNVVEKDYLRVLKSLADIRNGASDLLAVPLKPTQPSDGLIVVESSPRLFGRR